jgi:hypothetical protein
MVKETKLESYARALITYKFITSSPGTFSDRAKRRYDKTGLNASLMLKEKEEIPKDSQFILSLKYSDEATNWARKLSLALEEFKQVNPKAYKQFQGIRRKHRDVRRYYLEFGLKKGKQLPEEDYIEAIKNIVKGLGEREAKNVCDSVKILDTALKKKKKSVETLLLPE